MSFLWARVVFLCVVYVDGPTLNATLSSVHTVTLASIFSLSVRQNARAAKLVRRLRAVQLARPGAEQPQPSLPCVDAFLDYLVELPLADWLAIGEAIVAARDGLVVRQRAWDELQNSLVWARQGLIVWNVRDAVETAAYIATRESQRWSRHQRETFAAAHAAAEAAALALLASDDLQTETYRTLTAPFATAIHLAQSTQRV